MAAWQLCLVLPTLAFVQGVQPDIDTAPTRWPSVFHAVLLQNRSSSIAKVDLYYEFPRNRTANIITPAQHSKPQLLDLEYNNRTSFYIYPSEGRCKTIQFGVGILRPNWLDGAALAGKEVINNQTCLVWTKADFITYYEFRGRPVRWVFFDGATFDVISFEEGVTLPDKAWQAPASCFWLGRNHAESYEEDLY